MRLYTQTRFNDNIESLATEIVDIAFQVHKTMRAGLLERVYEECFVCELKDRSIPFERQKLIPLQYKYHKIDIDYKLDLLVDDTIIIELKAVYKINDLHRAQLLSYMHLTDKKLGFLINFNVPLIKDGIQRIAL